jgi:glutamate racemase
VSQRFYEKQDKAAARSSLNLPQTGLMVMVMCGSAGCGPVRRMVRELLEHLPDVSTVAVICGNNERLLEDLSQIEDRRLRVIGYTRKIHLYMDAADMLVRRGAKALVIACNTATAAAIGALRQAYPQLIVIGIEPALKIAADRFPQGTVGVMATPVTLREEKFQQQLERFPQLTVHRIPVPELVELIEQGHTEDAMVEELLRPVLAPYAGKLDAVVLGCTHYPFAKATIRKILGENTMVLDGGEGTARQTFHRLEQAGLLNTGDGSVQIENSSHDPEKIAFSMALLNKKETGL